MKAPDGLTASLAAFLLVQGCGGAAKPKGGGSDADLIANATSAAPAAVSREATVIAFDAAGNQRTLRQGTAEFTCFPDNPATPGNDPMCFDRNGLPWANALMKKESPPAGPVGVAYMLQGSWAASNTNPSAASPGKGERWVETGPALMILNTKGILAGYPREPKDPAQPFVMWPGTPYEHLMVPVGSSPR